MPLVACHTCQVNIASSAPYCPSCGAPNPSDSREGREALRLATGPSAARIAGGVLLGTLATGILFAIFWFLVWLAFGSLFLGAMGAAGH